MILARETLLKLPIIHSFFFISIEGPKIRDAYKKLGEKSGYTEGKSLSIMMLIKKMSVAQYSSRLKSM